MARSYDFQLPVDLSGLQDSFGISELQSAGLWDKVPSGIRKKMEDGAGFFGSGVEVTESDLDELPDDVWAYVAQQLNLSWHEKV